MKIKELLEKDKFLYRYLIEDIGKLINVLRDFNATDEQIYQYLVTDYGNVLTHAELKEMLEEAKR